LEDILPALVGKGDIEVNRLDKPFTTASAIHDLISRGAKLTEIPLRYYRESIYSGVNRKLDNSEFLKGKETLYDDLEHALRVRHMTDSLIKEMIAFYDRDEATLESEGIRDLASMEMQDLDKVTAQHWKPTGWFLNSPVTDAEVPKLSEDSRAMLRKVAAHYGEVLRSTGLDSMHPAELTLMDSDPQDTMTGSPTFASGDNTHEARITLLAASPRPSDHSPAEYKLALDSLNARLGLPDHVIYSPVLSTRHGPMRKPVKLFTRTPAGYEAHFDSVGAYDRTRFVYPAPYLLNFILSPVYVQMAGVRKKKLGLWHDPESQASYIPKLQQQGKTPWSIDFSGMDTGMFPSIIQEINSALIKAGFSRWALELFSELYGDMGIIFPSYYGRPGSATFLQGPVRPWCSGFKLTSEYDTIYGAAVLLDCLEQQIPGISDQWISGSFVFLELGDDVHFTHDGNIDAEKLRTDALSRWGAKLEIIRDAMFLKWLLPTSPEIPEMTRPLSRFIQQTIYNEDSYTGVKGGDRPPAVMRLALMARMTALDKHPHFTRWWPAIYKLLLELKFVRDASPEYQNALRQGKAVLDVGDEQVIFAYSQRESTYLDSLKERAKFEPSAAALLKILIDLGMDDAESPADVGIRQQYVKALYDQIPGNIEFQTLFDIVSDFTV
jgi:hypothetical protein